MVHDPVLIDEEICTGCNLCVDVCPMDIFEPCAGRGFVPTIGYPDECRYCGACWYRCPYRDKGCIRIVVPPAMRLSVLRG
jgi:adenylylsulfate reductase subunit B